MCVALRGRAKYERTPRGRILKEKKGERFAQSLGGLGGAGRGKLKSPGQGVPASWKLLGSCNYQTDLR